MSKSCEEQTPRNYYTMDASKAFKAVCLSYNDGLQ